MKEIEEEEKNCDRYLTLHCRDFIEALEKSQTSKWDDRNLPQGEEAQKQIRQSLQKIKDRSTWKSREISADFKSGLERRISDFPKYGLGRPWGTEFRRYAATALGISTEVNDLFDLGLNSITNSKSVYLGEHFINLIKNDPAIVSLNDDIRYRICNEIKRNAIKVPSINVISMGNMRINDSKPIQLGGNRAPDDMIQQLKFTLVHPQQSLKKYADTWNVALNELTWAIRGATVRFIGVYHAVYNLYGFAYVRELEFSIDDKLDLRPRSGRKIDFNKADKNYAYNAVCSVLGSLYHDLFGNTDSMRVRVKWTDFGPADNQIYKW